MRQGKLKSKWFKIGMGLLSLTLVIVLGLATFAWLKVSGSLARLDGEVALPGLNAAVTVERDDLGVPTLRGEHRLDVLQALGFLHGQERFFQMDLLRRKSGGELSELFGSIALELDRTMRRHRFRQTAESVWAGLPTHHRERIDAYVRGVNQGLADLDSPPFEYLLLGMEPRPWEPTDSLMCVYAMFLDLQDGEGDRELSLAILADQVPAEMFAFLTPWGSPWDASLDGMAHESLVHPGEDVVDLRRDQPFHMEEATAEPVDAGTTGSNNWAVAGAITEHGGAILANDMHLGIRVPNVWYRVDLIWPDPDGGEPLRATGVTLPGTPTLVSGSNGHVAWGFTNSYADFCDLILVEPAPDRPDHYLTPEGPRPFETVRETIRVKGGESEEYTFKTTIWGSVAGKDHRGREYVNHWAAHDPEAVNLVLDDLLSARTVEEVVFMAKRAGLPGQNLVCADREGHIAWTVAGRIPRKQGEAGMLPRSWADGSHGWRGWLEPEEVPTVISPPGHRLWTANNRVASLEEQRGVFGNGGFDIGARAGQIRDRLLAKDRFTERDLLAIQMDDEARFLTEWRQLLLQHLDEKALADVPARAEYRRFVENWAGRAAADDVGYFLVRDYRMKVLNALLPVLTGGSEQTDKRFSQWHLPQRDGVIWHLLQARPAHFLPAEWPDWHAFHLAMVDRTLEDIELSDRPLSEHTWGFHNKGVFAHPFGNAIPILGDFLNMPVTPMSGDVNLPRVQRGIHGASERMVVSPGREDRGFFHMPCGQSGHPLSPYYRAGHDAWLNGEPTPFLPGPPVHRLVLAPESR